MHTERIYRMNVAVDVSFDYLGHMVPPTVHDEDGEIHWVDHIFSTQPTSCAGNGIGVRFDVKIDGRACALCFEQRPDPCRSEIGHWYLELPESMHMDNIRVNAGA